MGFFDSSLKSFSFKINRENFGEPINFDKVRVFEAPTNLAINNINGRAVLIWEDKVGDVNNDVDHYEIYVKKHNEPYLHLFSQVKEKSYELNINWQEAIANTYAVRTTLKDGKSTFLSQPTFFVEEDE